MPSNYKEKEVFIKIMELKFITKEEAAFVIKQIVTNTKNHSLGSISRLTGIHRPHISHFLARDLDLIPVDINIILSHLQVPLRVVEANTLKKRSIKELIPNFKTGNFKRFNPSRNSRGRFLKNVG